VWLISLAMDGFGYSFCFCVIFFLDSRKMGQSLV
jgi:hypothetical protein